jgi:hypothetical protein
VVGMAVGCLRRGWGGGVKRGKSNNPWWMAWCRWEEYAPLPFLVFHRLLLTPTISLFLSPTLSLSSVDFVLALSCNGTIILTRSLTLPLSLAIMVPLDRSPVRGSECSLGSSSSSCHCARFDGAVEGADITAWAMVLLFKNWGIAGRLWWLVVVG